MSLGQFGVELSGLPQMIHSRLQLTLDHVNYSGEVIGLGRLLLIAGPRVFGGPEEILQGLWEIDDMVKVDLSDRTMDRVIGVVSFFGLQKIAERLLIPAVQISPFGARAISPGLALELGQADFFEDARQRLLLHLQTPDEVAQQQIEIGLEALQAARQLFNSQRQSQGVPARAAQAFWIQSSKPRLDRDPMIPRRQPDDERLGLIISRSVSGSTRR